MNFTAFAGGAASGTVVGGITVTTTGGSFTGSLSLTGADAAKFAISGTNLVTNGTIANGTYAINIVATQGGTAGQPVSTPFTIYGSATTTLPESTNYAPSGSSYQAFLAPYQPTSHTQSLLIYNACFPNNCIFSFNWSGTAQTVQGYSAIDFGNYTNTSVSVPVTPAQVGTLGVLTSSFNIGVSGNTAGFDIIFDMFLTTSAAPNGGSAPLACEIEVFLHTPSYSQGYINAVTQLGTFTSGGITWQVAHDVGGSANSDYLFAPVGYADITVGTIDLRAMFRFLLTCSIPISSSWYYNGHDLGVEAANGAGTFTVGSYSVNYSPT